ncbi:MAG: hypothetical protein ACTSYC_03380 [Promethearchaeota archaeon]
MEILKIKEKIELISDEKRRELYELAKNVSKVTLEELCPALFRICLNAPKGSLKNELGRVIFHLQKNERLSTLIGLQKLLEATLLVDPKDTFELLESSEKDAQELAKKIKAIL